MIEEENVEPTEPDPPYVDTTAPEPTPPPDEEPRNDTVEDDV